MNISDSFLKAQLRNTFWIGGAACGGKTTITDLLAEKHDLRHHHPEKHFHEHKKAASAEDHPSHTMPFRGWEWFFNRPIDEYMKAITDTDREHFEMVILDLVRLNGDSRVVADVHPPEPSLAHRITEHNKSVLLYADEETIQDCFFARADEQDLLGVINTLSDPAGTQEHILDMVCTLSARKRAEAEASGVKVLVRDGETDLQETLAAVEEHFGLA